MKEKLLEKRNMYAQMRTDVECETYDIEAKVAEYRAALEKEAERVKARKLEKIDIYIELLDKLIEEAVQEEQAAEEVTAEVVQEAPVEEIKEEEV